MDDIMVSICCTTYNQQNYIADALESFLMQKTNFAFEILIHDDASTDRTVEIIKAYERNYPKIIKPIYQTENQYSKGVVVDNVYNFSRAKGKYIAFCEGDDFWVDENKLQIQVDYMEQHKECCLCIHSALKVSREKKSIGEIRPDKVSRSFTTVDMILGEGGMFATNSIVFPTKLTNNMPDFYFNAPVGDYPLVIYLSLMGDVFYIDKCMSAYRVMAMNSWTSKIQGNIGEEIKHNQLIENMLNEIDEYTKFAYSDAIKKRIKQNRFNIMLQQRRFKEAKEGEYREFYNALNVKNKTKIYLKQYCPRLVKVLKKIKKEVA